MCSDISCFLICFYGYFKVISKLTYSKLSHPQKYFDPKFNSNLFLIQPIPMKNRYFIGEPGLKSLQLFYY